MSVSPIQRGMASMCVRSSEMGVISVPVNTQEGDLSCVYFHLSKGGVASVSVIPSEGGMVSVLVNHVEEAWLLSGHMKRHDLCICQSKKKGCGFHFHQSQ